MCWKHDKTSMKRTNVQRACTNTRADNFHTLSPVLIEFSSSECSGTSGLCVCLCRSVCLVESVCLSFRGYVRVSKNHKQSYKSVSKQWMNARPSTIPFLPSPPLLCPMLNQYKLVTLAWDMLQSSRQEFNKKPLKTFFQSRIHKRKTHKNTPIFFEWKTDTPLSYVLLD